MGSAACPESIWSDADDDTTTDEELEFHEFVPDFGEQKLVNVSSPIPISHPSYARQSPQEIIREEAWERRRQMERQKCEMRRIWRSSSDCGSQQHKIRLSGEYSSRAPNRSLTEEDFEELQGCIDLGFRFGGKEDLHLCNTLPALEVCYAVNRQMEELNSDSSSLSSMSSCSDGSVSPTEPQTSWTIASPGDDLHEVKEKLKHWARAVACISRQSCS